MTKEKIKKKRGRPSKAELQRRKEAKEKDTIIKVVTIIGVLLFGAIFVQQIKADQIVHKFKSPSFKPL